jgi:hypothetical protein
VNTATDAVLVGDVGGTHARFGLWRRGALVEQAGWPTAALPSLTACVARLRGTWRFGQVAVAVAGPVMGAVGAGARGTRGSTFEVNVSIDVRLRALDVPNLFTRSGKVSLTLTVGAALDTRQTGPVPGVRTRRPERPRRRDELYPDRGPTTPHAHADHQPLTLKSICTTLYHLVTSNRTSNRA